MIRKDFFLVGLDAGKQVESLQGPSSTGFAPRRQSTRLSCRLNTVR